MLSARGDDPRDAPTAASGRPGRAAGAAEVAGARAGYDARSAVLAPVASATLGPVGVLELLNKLADPGGDDVVNVAGDDVELRDGPGRPARHVRVAPRRAARRTGASDAARRRAGRGRPRARARAAIDRAPRRFREADVDAAAGICVAAAVVLGRLREARGGRRRASLDALDAYRAEGGDLVAALQARREALAADDAPPPEPAAPPPDHRFAARGRWSLVRAAVRRAPPRADRDATRAKLAAALAAANAAAGPPPAREPSTSTPTAAAAVARMLRGATLSFPPVDAADTPPPTPEPAAPARSPTFDKPTAAALRRREAPAPPKTRPPRRRRDHARRTTFPAA